MKLRIIESRDALEKNRAIAMAMNTEIRQSNAREGKIKEQF